MVRDGDGRPPRVQCTLAVHCFCVCSGSALLGDLLGVRRSTERDLPFVLLIYPRIFFGVFIACRLLMGFLFVVLLWANCSCVLHWFSCQYCKVIGYRKTPLVTPS